MGASLLLAPVDSLPCGEGHLWDGIFVVAVHTTLAYLSIHFLFVDSTLHQWS